jgi:predicted DNA-binding transcriptional regulator YafY
VAPTSRVLTLLEILQSGGTRTLAELAERLGVDKRTVRRYVQHLIDLEIPVESVRGRHGGYRLLPGFRMPPLMLTDEEALATLLGLVAGHRAGLVSTSLTAVDSAVAKFRRVLPLTLARRLDGLLETTEFTTPPRTIDAPDAAVLLVLAEAARDHRPVVINYTSAAGQRTERTIEPFGIVAHAGRWYVTGADSASGENRTFRVDRISTARARPGTFSVPEGFAAADQVLSGLARTPYRHQITLRVRASMDEVRLALPMSLAALQEIDDRPDWVQVDMRVEELDWVPAVLARLGHAFVIERPDALRDRVRALAELLTAAATDGDTHER